MIKKIFWDIDETLIHTSLKDPDQECHKFFLSEYLDEYYCIVRPCAKRLIDFSRELIGKENVYILTASTQEYANAVNKLADFGFDEDHILAREEIKRYKFSTAYGYDVILPREDIASRKNILIDNLPPRYNEDKMNLIGITLDRYYEVVDYYGVNYPDDPFEKNVKNFILDKFKK